MIDLTLRSSLFGVLLMYSLTVVTVNGNGAKIVGGQKAEEHIPYQVSLQHWTKSSKTGQLAWVPICGGAIISKKSVLTVVHCLHKHEPANLSVVVGTNDLRNNGSKGTRHMVSRTLIHSDFLSTQKSEIGIAYVVEDFTFGPNVTAITYSDNQVGAGVECTLSGWGYTTSQRIGPEPQDLQKVTLKTISNAKCRDLWPEVHPKQICTYTKVGKGACMGDSGGPLVCGGELVGLVDYGAQVCAFGLPDVYTRVSKFKAWIDLNKKSAVC
ncbi:chymotrypsin-1-like [Armigeres subalbatus]|uniref:chymotrypsin-1-like n=1 Tax=Armigeres subalbatus TaxID=124917 RepID=UPI002ED40AEA